MLLQRRGFDELCCRQNWIPDRGLVVTKQRSLRRIRYKEGAISLDLPCEMRSANGYLGNIHTPWLDFNGHF